MKGKIRDCCIGYAVKIWLLLIWLFIILAGNRALGQEPKTDHIKRAGCTVLHNKDFTLFGLHESVLYTDGTDDWAIAIEINNPDVQVVLDQCKSFSLAMQMARIEEDIENVKAEIKRQRRDHYFLDARKVAKR